jgi:LysM repeat protein
VHLTAPAASPAPPPTQPGAAAASYTVQSGDTLSGIARKFGVTVDAIVKANNIADPSRTRPGQIFVIPAK